LTLNFNIQEPVYRGGRKIKLIMCILCGERGGGGGKEERDEL